MHGYPGERAQRARAIGDLHRRAYALAGAGLSLAALWPTLAWAHEETGQAAGFLAGLTHPVSGLDHVLAMVAVGFWGAQLGAPALWLLPVAFPMIMAVGGLLGLVGIPLPGVEIGIAASALVLGAMVMREVKPPAAVAALLVGIFAIFHGHAHGTELPDGANGLYYSIGFVVATGLLHAAGIGFGMIHSLPRGPAILRAAGGIVLLGGVYFLWLALS
jgi:urease accessory protein